MKPTKTDNKKRIWNPIYYEEKKELRREKTKAISDPDPTYLDSKITVEIGSGSRKVFQLIRIQQSNSADPEPQHWKVEC